MKEFFGKFIACVVGGFALSCVWLLTILFSIGIPIAIIGGILWVVLTLLRNFGVI